MAGMETKRDGAAKRASLPGVQDELPGIIAPVARVEAWLKVAAPGDRLQYAVRSSLPPGNATAARLRQMQEQGLVMLVRKRSDTYLGEFVYLAHRTSASIPGEVAAPRRATLAATRLDQGDHELADRLLPLLLRAARFGRPCPTDKQLATKLEVHADSIPAAFDALRARRDIVVHGVAAPTLRRVTIVATGAQTGLAA